MRKVCLTFVAVFQFCLLSAGVAAQSNTVTGRVVDAQGASVAGAEVTLLPATGRGRTTRSAADGTFSLEAASTGPQTLTVRAPGFADFSQSLAAGATSADITLQVAGLVEDVSVQGALLGTAATGKTNLPVRDMPMTVHTVPNNVIQEQGANDLVTALQNVPGVYAFTNYGIYEGYTFRGFVDLFPSLANQLLDGVRHEGNRINSAADQHRSHRGAEGPIVCPLWRRRHRRHREHDPQEAVGATRLRRHPGCRQLDHRPRHNSAPPAVSRRMRSCIASTSESKAKKATATTTRSVSRSRRRWPGARRARSVERLLHLHPQQLRWRRRHPAGGAGRGPGRRLLPGRPARPELPHAARLRHLLRPQPPGRLCAAVQRLVGLPQHGVVPAGQRRLLPRRVHVRRGRRPHRLSRVSAVQASSPAADEPRRSDGAAPGQGRAQPRSRLGRSALQQPLEHGRRHRRRLRRADRPVQPGRDARAGERAADADRLLHAQHQRVLRAGQPVVGAEGEGDDRRTLRRVPSQQPQQPGQQRRRNGRSAAQARCGVVHRSRRPGLPARARRGSLRLGRQLVPPADPGAAGRHDAGAGEGPPGRVRTALPPGWRPRAAQHGRVPHRPQQRRVLAAGRRSSTRRAR